MRGASCTMYGSLDMGMGMGGIGFPYWSTGCRIRPPGPLDEVDGLGASSVRTLLLVLREGLRALSGIVSS